MTVIRLTQALLGSARPREGRCGEAAVQHAGCTPEEDDDPQSVPLRHAAKCRSAPRIATRSINLSTTTSAYQMWLVGKRTPDWSDAGDSTLILRRAQLKMRVREVEEALILLNRLNEGQLQGGMVPFMGDKTGQPASLDRRKAALDQFRGRLDLTDNIAVRYSAWRRG